MEENADALFTRTTANEPAIEKEGGAMPQLVACSSLSAGKESALVTN